MTGDAFSRQRLRQAVLTIAAVMIAAVAGLEILTWMVGAVRLGTLSPGISTRRLLLGANEEPLERPDLRQPERRLFGAIHILHPYLGFVHDPSAYPGTNRFGFMGPTPLTKRSKDRINVLLTGGSVAQELFAHSGRLRALLSSVPAFAGKEIVLMPVCLGGYKQPQQLQALSLLLALGSEFDVVLNLDGFNEAVLPYGENLPRGVDPSFPRSWDLFARRGLRLDQVILIGRMSILREQRENWRVVFAQTPLRYSLSALTLWQTRDQRFDAEIRGLQAQLEQILIDDRQDSEQVRGPGLNGRGSTQVIDDSVGLWKSASRQMRALCEANGIRYFHFLQPNQHFSGSKPLTAQEAALLAGRDHFTLAAKEAVARAYPMMRTEGKALRRSGLRFHDLTGLFVHRKDTLYRDSCCHVNDLGYQLIGEAIGGAVSEDYRAAPPKTGGRPESD